MSLKNRESIKQVTDALEPFLKAMTMGCKICGRSSCTESFHSLEEQEEFETKTGRYAPEDDEENDNG